MRLVRPPGNVDRRLLSSGHRVCFTPPPQHPVAHPQISPKLADTSVTLSNHSQGVSFEFVRVRRVDTHRFLRLSVNGTEGAPLRQSVRKSNPNLLAALAAWRFSDPTPRQRRFC